MVCTWFGEYCSCCCLPLLLNLPAAFSQPRTNHYFGLCTPSIITAGGKCVPHKWTAGDVLRDHHAPAFFKAIIADEGKKCTPVASSLPLSCSPSLIGELRYTCKTLGASWQFGCPFPEVTLAELMRGSVLGLKQSSPVLSPPSPKLGLGLQSHLNCGPSVSFSPQFFSVLMYSYLYFPFTWYLFLCDGCYASCFLMA